MVWPLATASSISLTELSRATASGMNACGNNTVSRSGSTGISGGTRNEGESDPAGVEDFVWVAHVSAAS